MLQVLDNFIATQIKKPKNFFLSCSGFILILVKCLKNGWPDTMLDRKRIKSYTKKSDNTSLRYIFQVGVSAGHVVPWIAEQNFFSSPMSQIGPRNKVKVKKPCVWNGILGEDNYNLVHSNFFFVSDYLFFQKIHNFFLFTKNLLLKIFI